MYEFPFIYNVGTIGMKIEIIIGRKSRDVKLWNALASLMLEVGSFMYFEFFWLVEGLLIADCRNTD